MIDFLCKLWPFLAGGLIGWLAAGWLARKYRNNEPPIEKIIEKQVDNPAHLSLISKLESENKEIAGLKTRLSGYESASPKSVDNPVHLKRISELEAQLKAATSSPSTSNAQSAISSSTKTVDNPVHLKRISELEAQLENANSSSNRTAQSLTSGSANSGNNPDQTKRIKDLEKQVRALKKGPEIDLEAAKAAGFKLKSQNDLTAIEGIGPKINDLMKDGGVKTFAKLADTPVTKLQSVLNKGGSRYQIANPGTWPDQANLAANNRWPALKALQDVLVGGVYPDNAKASKKTTARSSATSGKKTTASNKTSAKSVKSQAVTTKKNIADADKTAAKAAGFKLKVKAGQDDFTVVEGIGPKINDLIHGANIHRYAELAKTTVTEIQKILDDAGPRYKLAKPGTWPAQAEMAAANKWDALKKWQDELDGGK